MHKLNAFATISILLISTLNSPIFFSSIALSQEGSNATTPTPSPAPTDLCSGVTCQPTKTTCPDGFVTSCTPTCESSTGKCGTCTPSCTGHEKQQEAISCPTPKTCPDGKTTVSCRLVNNACTCDQCPTTTSACPTPPLQPSCTGGTLKTKFDDKGCVTGYECVTTTTATCGNNICESGESTTCPSDCLVKPKPCPLLPVPSCQPGQTLQTKTTPDGCSISECVTPTTCDAPPKPPICDETQGLIQKFDDKRCVVGYECKEIPKAEVGKVATCPEVPPPTISCQANEHLSKTTDDKGCVVGYNCVSTASSVTEAHSVCPTEIPEKPSCDGSVVPIFDRGCLIYYTCVPEGCRQETDSSGFVRVECEQERVCPADEQQEKLVDNCKSQGGNPVPFQDPSGCTFYDCGFDNREVNANPLGGHQSCPAREEIEQLFSKCEATGLTPRVTFEGGCKIVKCSHEEGPVCRHTSDSEKLRIDNECSARGLAVARDVDANGCTFYRCGGAAGVQACQRDIPPEAYKKCDSIGGEMVVKNDRNGCVVFSQCVAQGDENDAYVERVEEVPDATALLSLALKLEQLKIELQKLATESKEIAKYYASTESLDEERYSRVSDMFDSAAQRIDEIKIEIRDNLDDLTTDDLEEIRHDIKYIKEVTLKDILYLMLSNSDDVKETLESSKKVSGKKLSTEELEANVKSCGTDGFCFDKAIRACKPVSFQPEGRQGPSMTIKGLEEGKCVLHVIMQSEDMIPPGFTKDSFYMDCPISNYALGVRGPEDVIPNCEGPMAKFAKQFGGAAEISGGDAFQDIIEKEGGPGGCKTERECATYCLDNYDECKKWVKEHPSVGPIPSREELRTYASGEEIERREEFRGKREVRSFAGPGGCTGPQECDKFCRSNPDECLKWCDENPDICPKPQARGGSEEEFRRQGEFERGLPTGPRGAVSPQPVSRTPESVQACVGCLNNGVCDIGECSECGDCLKGGRSITSEIVRRAR